MARASTAARGYGHEHRKRRLRALADLVPGTPCRRCKAPMLPGQRLDLGHNPSAPASSGAVADELEHEACNRGHRMPLPTSREW